MMAITASTASSPRRENAPWIPACVGAVTGISVMAKSCRAAFSAMASRVRMFPSEDSENEITPMVRKLPRLSARAALLGRYPSSFIAAMTCRLVAARTSGLPFATRDTVWVETPASTATSTIDTRSSRPRCRGRFPSRSEHICPT